MANTYSSWEYSQGPTLYIDSSGFESIDDNKNFIYFYIVTYSPVEYKRKVTDETGTSTYEYKYSFGTDNSSRKILDRYTFSGKNQLTKTVTHTVTEDGHKDTISKTFIIDTNIASNLDTNIHIVVNPTLVAQISNWKFNTTSSVTIPQAFNGTPRGWVTVTKTGYRTCSYTSYGTSTSWGRTGANVTDPPSTWGGYSYYGMLARTSIGYYDGAIKQYETDYYTYWKYKGEDYRSENDGGKIQKKQSHTYSYTSYYTQSYTYKETYGSYGTLSLKSIRDKIKSYTKYSSIVLRFRTGIKLNQPPVVSIDSAVSKTANRKTLTCKLSGEIAANDVIEYYFPMSYLTDLFANFDDIYVFIDKDKCTPADGPFYESYAFVETEADKMPYINLLVQSFDATSDSWVTACTVPYLNYKEIDLMRETKQHISKNLFFPIDLPKTNSNYRIKLDTNLVAKETEMFTNFRLDVLAKQLIPPGSITDHKLFINNDDLEHETEIEVGEIDELRLNVLEKEIYSAKTYPGFLKQGANDVRAYLRNTVTPIDDTIPDSNISKNVWYNYVSSINGNWISNQKFVANTFDFTQINILHGNNPSLENNLISFEVPYNNLKPNSVYKLIFTVNAEEAFKVSDLHNIQESSEADVIKSKFITKTSYDKNKISIDECDLVFYSPAYKLVSSGGNILKDEIDTYNRDIQCTYIINTKDIDTNDNSEFVINFKTKAVKNIIIKNLQCLCIDNDGVKHLDIIEPHNTGGVSDDRKYETKLVIYYDGFNLEHVNPLLYDDLIRLREQLDKIRLDYTIEPYHWSNWANTTDIDGQILLDKYGHPYGVDRHQPLRAIHFNEVKSCCVDTYEKLLALKPPVILNSSPSMLRDNIQLIPLVDDDPTQGYVLQHGQDKEGNIMDIDKYFPEWRKIIELINRN